MASTRARRSLLMAAVIAIGLTIMPVGEAFRDARAQGGAGFDH